MHQKIIFLFLLYFVSNSYAQETSYYDNWSKFIGRFSDSMAGVTSSQSLDMYLFNSFLDINQTVYNVLIPAPFPAGIGIGVGGSRKVVFNSGINDFYTVMDKFRIMVFPNLSGSYYGVSFGASLPFNFYVTNIRQVGPKEYTKLDPIETLFEKIKENFKKKNIIESSLEQEETDKDFYANFLPSNETVERRATWSKFWNPITMAFRLPLSSRKANKMADSEILSYNLQGGIELGVGFGINTPTGISILRQGVDASVYFRGNYEIIILKEKPQKPGENFVRVKIGKHKGTGYSLGGGSGADSLTSLTSGHLGPLEGNFVYTFLGSLVNVRPFRIQWDQSYWLFFNQVYRFDLNNPDAQKAYQKAVLGKLNLAEKMAFDENGKPKENSPVTRILSSKEKAKLKGHRRSIELFFLTLRRDGVIKSSDKILIDENMVEHRYFETEALNSRVVEALFKFQEKRSHRFRVSIDLKAFNNFPRNKDSLILLIDGEKGDTNTKSKEYLEYITEVEDSLNLPGLFPLPPLAFKKEWFKGNLGQTSFNYQLKLNLDQIEKLINFPEEKMWTTLSEAFNAKGEGWENPTVRKKLIAKSIGIYAGTLPVTLVGEKFPPKDSIIIASIKHSRWEKLKDEYLFGPERFAKALADFFNSGDYGPEMIKLIRLVLSGEKIPYKLNVFNPLLADNANLQKDEIGELTSPIEKTIAYSFETFDQNFEKVNVTNWSVELVSNQYIRFFIDFDKEPKSVFFNLEKSQLAVSLGKAFLGSVVISNKNGLFKKGGNTIMVKIGEHRHPLNNLVNQIKVKKYFFFPIDYKFSVAASLDERKYGYAARRIIRATLTESSKELEKYLKYTAEDFKLCLGRSALNLILFLEKRPLLVCPETAPRNPDGTCIEGMYPYGYFKTSPLKENLEKRNSWIYNNCPKEGSEEYIKKVTQIEAVCLGKSPTELISILGTRPFYVCPEKFPKNPDGTCISGIIPYQLEIEEDNLNSRNEWIIKYCSQ
jgi:hypothetical protein